METLTHMLPVGYRFAPTDEELIKNYLANKVFYRLVPVEIIKDIDASLLFSMPPNCLVGNAGREWFFFIHQDEYFRGEIRKIRTIENGNGFWRCIGDEEPIYNSNGDILAFKIHLTYFSGSLLNAKKTHWRMEEYRLRIGCKTEEPEEECILGRILRGRDYNDCF